MAQTQRASVSPISTRRSAAPRRGMTAGAAVGLFAVLMVGILASGFFLVPDAADRQEDNWAGHAWAHLMQAMLSGALAVHLRRTHAIRPGDHLARAGYVLLVWGAIVYFVDSYLTAMFGDVTSWTHSLWLQGPTQLPVNIGLPLVGLALGVRQVARVVRRRTTTVKPGAA